MSNVLATIEWLKEIRTHFEKDAGFTNAFNDRRRDAIDATISMLEQGINEYQREQAKHLFKDLINEYYGIRPLDIHYDFLTKYLNKPVATDCYKTAEEYREDFLNLKTVMDSRYIGHKNVHRDLDEKIDKLEGDIERIDGFEDCNRHKIIRAENDIANLYGKTSALDMRMEKTNERIDDLIDRIEKLEEDND